MRVTKERGNRIKIIISNSRSELTVIDELVFVSNSSLVLTSSSLTGTESGIFCILTNK